MEKKLTRDTTKEDHYIEIAVGFKVIYNQNQYLAYTEVPKRKREVPLEIYIGKLSILRDQYLLFRCETESEKSQVFSYFKQVFSGEITDKIEMENFSNIERISIVSSDQFDEKMDQYPNFFTLPKKEEEISATITLPSFLMKKSPKIASQPEEIQFVEDGNEVLESNVKEDSIEIEKTSGESTVAKNEVPSIKAPQTPEIPPIESITMNNEMTNMEVPQTPAMPSIEPLTTNNEMPSIEVPQTPEIPPIESITMNNEMTNMEVPQTPAMPSIEPTMMNSEIPSIEVPQTPEIPPIESITMNNEMTNMEIPQTPAMPSIEPTMMNSEMPSIEVPQVPEVESVLNETNASSKENNLAEEDSVRFTQITDKKSRNKSNKKKSKMSLMILMCITILLIAFIIIYLFVLAPKPKEKEPVIPNIPTEPVTAELVCTIQRESEEINAIEENSITMVYHKENKNILSSKENLKVTMQDAQEYAQRTSMIKVFSQELNNTDGQKYTFQYDEKNLIYQVFTDRNYEKALPEEKDNTWKTTYEEANEYYLEQGYTCNGVKREKTKRLNLTSTTGKETVEYNNWVITYQSAIVLEDETTLTVDLQVQNNTSEARTLNGAFKLYNKNNEVVRVTVLNQNIEAGKLSTVTLTIPKESGEPTPDSSVKNEAIDFDTLTSYLIELYR